MSIWWSGQLTELSLWLCISASQIWSASLFLWLASSSVMKENVFLSSHDPASLSHLASPDPHYTIDLGTKQKLVCMDI